MSFLTPAENLPLLRFNDLVIRTATLDDMNSIYTMGYDAWGDGLELNKYLFSCNNYEKYKKGTWYILEERNCILSSIICYSLPSIYDISTIGIGSLSTVSDKRRNGFARILLDAVKKSIATNLKQEHLFFTPILTLTTTRYRDSNLYQVFFKRKKILHVWLIVMTST